MIAKKNLNQRITRMLGSPLFFKLILAGLVLQAAWIALSGRYPMAFDENYHLGIIRLYGHHISPFWLAQPTGADQFGPLFRDPSYLYHYLMSFPYRLINLFTASQTVQVLLLRAINIGLAAVSLLLYRRLLLKTGASRALVHACLAALVLLPITPLLAAQINYDNLLLPFSAATLLLALKFGQTPDSRRFIGLLLACVVGSLIKFSFLPIAFVVFAYALLVIRRHGLGRPPAMDKLSWLLVLGLLLGSILFIERYGVNLARYHTPVPVCDKVLNESRCAAYAPWLRDNRLKQQKTDDVATSPVAFTGDWFSGMWLRTFFAVDGTGSNFATRGPLLVPGLTAVAVAGLGTLAVIVKWRALLRRYNRPALGLFLAASGLYVLALVIQEYGAYAATGQALAINGRYLLLIYPLLFVVWGLAISEVLRRRPALKAALVLLSLFGLLWGGGALTYILRSSDTWYWANGTVRAANHAVQRTVGPLTPGYRHPTQFLQFN